LVVVNIKQDITAKILLTLPEHSRPTLDNAMHTWWMNFREGGGQRLTEEGYNTLLGCELESYTFDIPVNLPLLAKNLLILDKKLDCPYYMIITKKPQIVLFGSRQAMMLAMYGDLQKWMTFLTRQ
jgi:hypothetical protein